MTLGMCSGLLVMQLAVYFVSAFKAPLVCVCRTGNPGYDASGRNGDLPSRSASGTGVMMSQAVERAGFIL